MHFQVFVRTIHRRKECCCLSFPSKKWYSDGEANLVRLDPPPLLTTATAGRIDSGPFNKQRKTKHCTRNL